MDLDDLDKTIMLSEGDELDENTSQLDYGGEDSNDDDDVQLLVVRPKSKSLLLPPPPEGLLDAEKAFTSKSGYIKELIEDSGLGIIFSMESGLVLFSTRHVCIDGERVDHDEVIQHVRSGSTVQFIEKTFESKEYSVLSPDCVLRQAVGIWIGEEPSHLLRSVLIKTHLEDLARDRREFISRIKNNDFLALDMVRSGGKIVGYLSKEVGIISTRDTSSGCRTHVFFHASDVYLYREALVLEAHDVIYDILPVGLNVRFDALRIRSDCQEVTHQACAVFVGTWPAVPHPTLLPGGDGTFTPCYDIPHSYTFYYLQLALLDNMEAKLRDFERILVDCRGSLRKNYIQVGPIIESYHDYVAWKQAIVPTKFLHSLGSRDRKGVKRNYHVFSKDSPTGPVIDQLTVVEKSGAIISVKEEPHFRIKKERN